MLNKEECYLWKQSQYLINKRYSFIANLLKGMKTDLLEVVFHS